MNINHKSREHALCFLYQCETERIHFFAANLLQGYVDHHQLSKDLTGYLTLLSKGVLGNPEPLHANIRKHSANWSFERIATIDRLILKIGIFELLQKTIAPKIIIDACVELAKLYGAENSSRFINGVLDAVAKDLGSL